MLVVVALLCLSCRSTPLFSMDPRVQNSDVGFSTNVSYNKETLVYIWLPPAYKDKYQPYRQALSADINALAQTTNVNNQHEYAQHVFNQSVAHVGGIFDIRSGKLDQSKLNRAVTMAIDSVAENIGKDTVVVFLSPYFERMQVIDHQLTWNNVKQYSSTHVESSRSTKNVLSVTASYYLKDGEIQQYQLGVDMEGEHMISEGKYRFIAEHLFSYLASD